MQKKKALFLLVVFLGILLMTFITIHSIDKGKSIIIKKIVEEIAKREGFDLHNLNSPSFVSRQADEKWRKLSWEQRKGYFLALLDEKSVKRLKSILNVLEENQQRLVIEEAAQLIKRYHDEIPEREWEELKRTLSDEKGRNMIKNIKRYYLIGLTPQERKKLHPIVDEIMSILEEVEK